MAHNDEAATSHVRLVAVQYAALLVSLKHSCMFKETVTEESWFLRNLLI